MPTATRHHEISEQFLEHAEGEFEDGDMLQASEKAWGALAHYVKGIAREREWKENRSHQHVRQNAEILAGCTGDPARNIDRLASIERLHYNFYEKEFSKVRVRAGLDAAHDLLAELKSAEKLGRFPMKRPVYPTVSRPRRQDRSVRPTQA